MSKKLKEYLVRGTIEIDVNAVVTATSAEEAADIAADLPRGRWVEDGDSFDVWQAEQVDGDDFWEH